MALDTELLDKFERDWNDALEQYAARTRAERLADTSVEPFRRTSIDPKVAAGIQDELFGPLQAKWGLLAGGGRRAAATDSSVEPRMFQTRAGVFSVDPITGEANKIIDVPPPTGVTSTPESRREMAVYNSALRRVENARRAGLNAVTRRERESADSELTQAQAALDALNASFAAPPQSNAPDFQVDPMTIPIGAPKTADPQIFMGDPMSPRIQDPPPAPLPAGPSVERGLRILSIRPKP